MAAVIAVAMYAFSVITLRCLAQTDTTECMVFSFAVILLSVGAGIAVDTGTGSPCRVRTGLCFVGAGTDRRDGAGISSPMRSGNAPGPR